MKCVSCGAAKMVRDVRDVSHIAKKESLDVSNETIDSLSPAQQLSSQMRTRFLPSGVSMFIVIKGSSCSSKG